MNWPIQTKIDIIRWQELGIDFQLLPSHLKSIEQI